MDSVPQSTQPSRYQSLPPEVAPDPPFFSARFIVIAIVVIGAAALAGSLQSGKLSLKQIKQLSGAATPAAQAHPATTLRPTPTIPIPFPKPGTFVVTAILLGQPSFAIINGKSRVEGDALEAPGVTGWRVKQIVDGYVRVQNGTTFASLPLTVPGIKPLDDELHPLN